MTKKDKKLIGSLIFTLLVLIFGGGSLVASDRVDEVTANDVVSVPSTDVVASINENFVDVTRVVDGDTIVVSINDEEKKVRLIGINAPESVDPRRKVRCFGKEASAYLKNLLDGRKVRLVNDESQDDVDKYGRLLRVVFLEDGTDVNKTMITDGYAYEYTYDTPYARQDEYKNVELDAKILSRGLWSNETCQGRL